jgi:hypothetical protein
MLRRDPSAATLWQLGADRAQPALCGRGNGLGPAGWGTLLSNPGLSGLTELNGLPWSPDRLAAVQSSIDRVVRRKAAPHIDLRWVSVQEWVADGGAAAGPPLRAV